MIGNLLTSQIDYVLFLYGLSFVAVAAATASLADSTRRPIPWLWLTLFSAAHGLSEWLDLLSRTLARGAIWNGARSVLLLSSSVCLFEFGRRGLRGKKWFWLPGCGIFAGVASLLGFSQTGVGIAARYGFLFPGGILAGLAFHRSASEDRDGRTKWLKVIGFAFLGYALAAGMVVPQAALFPASRLNTAAFLAASGLPIQVVRMALAATIGLGILEYSRAALPRMAAYTAPAEPWMHAGLAVVVTIGWALTQVVGQAGLARFQDAEQSTTRSVALSALRTAGEHGRSLSDYLEGVKTARPDIRSIRVLRVSDGADISVPVSASASPSGEPSPKCLTVVASGGQPACSELVSDAAGASFSTFASAGGPGRALITQINVDGQVYQQKRELARLPGIILTLAISLLLVALFSIQLRARAEMATVIESERQFDDLFSNMLNGLAYFKTVGDGKSESTSDLILLKANPAFYRHTGLRDAGLIGRSFREARPRLEAVAAEWMSLFRDVKKDGKSLSLVRHLKPLERWLSLAVYSPKPDHYAILCEDISAHKRLEEEGSQLEEKLRHSEKLALIGRLAGGVAHDFNNILTAIIGCCDLLPTELDDPDALRADISEIEKSARRAANLTQQLLAFGRKQVLSPSAVDLNETLSNLATMLRRLIGENVELNMSYAKDLGLAFVDTGQIEQVVVNLAVNSRDAMPRGGKLTIETANVFLDPHYARGHVEVSSGDYVMIAVSDTGAGMDQETLTHVFEPFFTTKPQGKGTGLGLSMVYGIVKQSGGHISVYSELGSGTTFKIYLPRVGQASSASRAVSRPAPIESGGSETILLVEDEKSIREICRRSLTTHGYRVLECEEAELALALARGLAQPVDLLLTDVVLKGKSGRVLAEELLTFSPRTKVLYISGYTDNVVVHHGILDAGVNFLQKPFSQDDLLRRIRGILQG